MGRLADYFGYDEAGFWSRIKTRVMDLEKISTEAHKSMDDSYAQMKIHIDDDTVFRFYSQMYTTYSCLANNADKTLNNIKARLYGYVDDFSEQPLPKPEPISDKDLDALLTNFDHALDGKAEPPEKIELEPWQKELREKIRAEIATEATGKC